MMMLLLLSCFAHKTSLKGVVDYTEQTACTVELETGETILIKSQICKLVKEGGTIIFYARKK